MTKPATLLVTTCALACLAWADPPAADEDPRALPDESWISLTGTVAATDVEEFTLDYGEGLITVEMDDWSWYVDELPLVVGDRVTVYDQIDDDFFEGCEIEATSIFVVDRSTYYYPYDVVPDVVVYSYPAVVAPEGSWVSLSGTVTAIDGREFVLDTGEGVITVDTIEMAYNPLDDVGYQEIDEDDRVSVSGRLDLDLFDEREIHAESIVSLTRDRGTAAG